MKVVEHTGAEFAIYSAGEPDGTISLWRKMSAVEAEFSFNHQTLQGGAIKWLSESFIKSATFTNHGVVGPTKMLEYRITLAHWAIIRAQAVAQHGAPAGAIQFHHEGLYRMDTTQGGPFVNFGIPPAHIAAFNAALQEVRVAMPYVYPKH